MTPQPSDAVSPDLVFLVGCPRSGTFLLASALNAELGLAIPVETHFIPLFERVLFLWGRLSRPHNRRRLVEAVFDFLDVWSRRAGKERDWAKLRPFTLLAVRDDAARIADAAAGYEDIVTEMFAAYARREGARLAGDKSAFFDHIPLERYARAVPRLKVVHLIRDGRDVALSWRSTWFGPKTLVKAMRAWKIHVERKRAWGRRHPERYLEVRYEDYLDAPEAVLERIRQFLAPPAGAPSARGREFARMLSQGTSHELLTQPPLPTNKEKWRAEMSAADRRLAVWVAGETLRACGYEAEDVAAGAVGRMRLRAVVLGSLALDFVSLRQGKLFLKGALPVALRVSQLLGVPLARILNARWPAEPQTSVSTPSLR